MNRLFPFSFYKQLTKVVKNEDATIDEKLSKYEQDLAVILLGLGIIANQHSDQPQDESSPHMGEVIPFQLRLPNLEKLFSSTLNCNEPQYILRNVEIAEELLAGDDVSRVFLIDQAIVYDFEFKDDYRRQRQKMFDFIQNVSGIVEFKKIIHYNSALMWVLVRSKRKMLRTIDLLNYFQLTFLHSTNQTFACGLQSRETIFGNIEKLRVKFNERRHFTPIDLENLAYIFPLEGFEHWNTEVTLLLNYYNACAKDTFNGGGGDDIVDVDHDQVDIEALTKFKARYRAYQVEPIFQHFALYQWIRWSSKSAEAGGLRFLEISPCTSLINPYLFDYLLDKDKVAYFYYNKDYNYPDLSRKCIKIYRTHPQPKNDKHSCGCPLFFGEHHWPDVKYNAIFMPVDVNYICHDQLDTILMPEGFLIVPFLITSPSPAQYNIQQLDQTFAKKDLVRISYLKWQPEQIEQFAHKGILKHIYLVYQMGERPLPHNPLLGNTSP